LGDEARNTPVPVAALERQHDAGGTWVTICRPRAG